MNPGETYRLRIINTATFSMFKFSIDEHDLTVLEVDGIDVEPYCVNMLSLNVAQRYSVLVTMNTHNQDKNYWIRADVQTSCFPTSVPLFNKNIWGIIHNSKIPLCLPTTNGRDVDDCIELNQMNLLPCPAQNWTDPPAISINWTINFENDANNVNLAYFNNISYTPPSTGFSLWNIIQNKSINKKQNPYTLDVEANSIIEFVINNFDGGEHPIHLHGHRFAVLGVGQGVYEGTTNLYPTHAPPPKNVLKYINPPKRDVIGVPANGWAVIRFIADNPGVWAFHCHIDWHFTAGLAATIIERPNDLKKFIIPQNVLDLCSY